MSMVLAKDEDNELIEVADTGALEALNRSEHDIKVTTAKKYPRSMRRFKNSALEMATMSEDVAGSCIYALPRAGKSIEGPSVRLAEILGASYGNMSYGSRIVACDKQWITAQGVCYDYENNVSACIEVRRRITDKNGKTFNDDMIQVTGRAACAIALREAIFKIVPRALWNEIYEQARITSIGKGLTMQAQRDKCMAWWKKAGATESQVLQFLSRQGIEEVTIDDLITLRGLVTTMKDEGKSVDDILDRSDSKTTGGAKKLSKNAPIVNVEPTTGGLTEAEKRAIEAAESVGMASSPQDD
ncbi:MAG: hypothetical protein ACOVLE_10980 [Pirellula staleyi]